MSAVKKSLREPSVSLCVPQLGTTNQHSIVNSPCFKSLFNKKVDPQNLWGEPTHHTPLPTGLETTSIGRKQLGISFSSIL